MLASGKAAEHVVGIETSTVNEEANANSTQATSTTQKNTGRRAPRVKCKCEAIIRVGRLRDALGKRFVDSGKQ
jgi:hypothetical protein